jgi:putative FmdB family regulatory protein
LSKLILFEYECPSCNLAFDELAKYEDAVNCPKCNAVATRLISAGHIDWTLGVQSSSFPTLADKWAKIQTQKARTDKGSLRDGAPNLKTY